MEGFSGLINVNYSTFTVSSPFVSGKDLIYYGISNGISFFETMFINIEASTGSLIRSVGGNLVFDIVTFKGCYINDSQSYLLDI